MNKYVLGLAITLLSLASSAQDTVLDERQQQAAHEAKNHGCPVSEAEEVVCGNLMCDFGLLFGEYPEKCWDYKAKLLVLRATLLPWESLPRCFKRDENCNKTGRAGKDQMDSSYCMENSKNRNDAELCLGALKETDAEYCGTLRSQVEIQACEEVKRTGKLTEEYCTNLAMEKAGIRRHFSWRNINITGTLEWNQIPEEQQARYNQVFQECMSLSAH